MNNFKELRDELIQGSHCAIIRSLDDVSRAVYLSLPISEQIRFSVEQYEKVFLPDLKEKMMALISSEGERVLAEVMFNAMPEIEQEKVLLQFLFNTLKDRSTTH